MKQIIYLSGKQGVGKTTLITRFKSAIELHFTDTTKREKRGIIFDSKDVYKVFSTFVFTSQEYNIEEVNHLKKLASQKDFLFFNIQIK